MTNLRELHSEFSESIANSFNVLDTIDLFDYDNNLIELVKRLSQSKKDVYEVNDRIVLLHFDTEFYLHHDRPGFLLTNLHLILTSLDIPFAFILLISNQKIDNWLTQLRLQYTHEPKNMQYVKTIFQKLLLDNGNNISNIELNQDKIVHHYSCLNGVARSHRVWLIALLNDANLISKGLVSFNAPV